MNSFKPPFSQSRGPRCALSFTLSLLGFFLLHSSGWGHSASAQNGPLAARDLWLHKAVSFDHGGYSATIPQHGVLLLRIDGVQ